MPKKHVRFSSSFSLEEFKKAIKKENFDQINMALDYLSIENLYHLDPHERKLLLKKTFYIVNKHAIESKVYDSKLTQDFLKNLINKFSYEEYRSAIIGFKLYMLLKHSPVLDSMSYAFNEDLYNVLDNERESQKDDNNSISTTNDAATTERTIGIENDDTTKDENRDTNTEIELKNDKNGPVSLEFLIEQSFSWLDPLPKWIQNKIKNSETYKAFVESIENTLVIYNNPGFIIKLLSDFEDNNNESTETNEESISANITKDLIDIDIIYEGPINFYINHNKFIGNIDDGAVLLDFN